MPAVRGSSTLAARRALPQERGSSEDGFQPTGAFTRGKAAICTNHRAEEAPEIVVTALERKKWKARMSFKKSKAAFGGLFSSCCLLAGDLSGWRSVSAGRRLVSARLGLLYEQTVLPPVVPAPPPYLPPCPKHSKALGFPLKAARCSQTQRHSHLARLGSSSEHRASALLPSAAPNP